MPMVLGDLKCLVHLFILLLFVTNTLLSVLSDYCPSANLSTSWTNNLSPESWSFSDGSSVRPIILKENAVSSGFGFGFFRNGSDDSFLVVFFVMPQSKSTFNEDYPLQIVWCANRDRPVGNHARLELTARGNLVLEDNDSVIWSTNTSGLSVINLTLTASGNLKLLNGSYPGIVWQSFHHPTDTWLPYQKLYPGQRLTARASKTNYSSGLYHPSVTNKGIYAFLDSNPPYMYHTLLEFSLVNTSSSNFTVRYVDGFPKYVKYIPKEFGFTRLEPSGHLNAYQFLGEHKPSLISNFLEDDGFGDCAFPTVCGSYGVCSDGQCSCPVDSHGNTSYFRQLNEFQPSLGCEQIPPLSCKHSEFHQFLELENVTYFEFIPSLLNTKVESCKKACLNNCSCKAALFRYQENASSGNCSLPSQLLSLMVAKKEVVGYSSYAFIKVQRPPYGKKRSWVLVFGPSLSVLTLCIIFVTGTCYCSNMQRKTNIEEGGDDLLIETLTKFSFEDLKAATQNFEVMLCRGGFGSVFEGLLGDGTKVAVKRLESEDQGKKEFLAEVNTMGSIHHFNLLRLIGYCAEKSNRLLVYEQMCNGSLDKWIFKQDSALQALCWETRRKIILGIARGLQYLHVHWNPNIIHFDIKPQNILLDEDFNVKICDFGLAKLIDKEKSQILTALKGTLGYMAPELFRGVNISVKADVYSFGIVILEIVCGRRNLDPSQFDTLIDKVHQMVEENRLHDLLAEVEEDIECHKEEALKMIEIAIWCLQSHDRRPFISDVVKVLDGLTDIEHIIDSHFLTLVHAQTPLQASSNDSTAPMASILSGPRG